MKVVPVPVRQDNYSYLLIDTATKKAAAVDSFDLPKLHDVALQLGVDIVANLTTHHHFDHSGGNKALKYPSVPIYGGSDKIPALTNLVKDKDEFTVGDNLQIKCLATSCHTQDSICYYFIDRADPSFPGGVLTGDTLFIGGCGRFFEGTGEEMVRALNYLGALPEQTVVYSGHEYTASNAAFAKSVEPNNPAVAKLEALAKENKITTGLSTIGDEKEWNVFMRTSSEAVRKATGVTQTAPDSQVLDALRELKNNFRG
ncbi:Beta-lactamase-like protein [Amanita muscaria]